MFDKRKSAPDCMPSCELTSYKLSAFGHTLPGIFKATAMQANKHEQHVYFSFKGQPAQLAEDHHNENKKERYK
jgi:hypothetical protein